MLQSHHLESWTDEIDSIVNNPEDPQGELLCAISLNGNALVAS
jgi:hypothetical protein